MSAQEEKGMRVHSLQDTVGRLSVAVTAAAVTLAEAQDTSGCSIWDHPHVLWHKSIPHTHRGTAGQPHDAVGVPQAVSGDTRNPLKTLSASEPL